MSSPDSGLGLIRARHCTSQRASDSTQARTFTRHAIMSSVRNPPRTHAFLPRVTRAQRLPAPKQKSLSVPSIATVHEPRYWSYQFRRWAVADKFGLALAVLGFGGRERGIKELRTGRKRPRHRHKAEHSYNRPGAANRNNHASPRRRWPSLAAFNLLRKNWSSQF